MYILKLSPNFYYYFYRLLRGLMFHCEKKDQESITLNVTKAFCGKLPSFDLTDKSSDFKGTLAKCACGMYALPPSLFCCL